MPGFQPGRHRFESDRSLDGFVAEWPKATVCKTVKPAVRIRAKPLFFSRRSSVWIKSAPLRRVRSHVRVVSARLRGWSKVRARLAHNQEITGLKFPAPHPFFEASPGRAAAPHKRHGRLRLPLSRLSSTPELLAGYLRRKQGIWWVRCPRRRPECPISTIGGAAPLQGEGYSFKSNIGYCAAVVQLVERRVANAKVADSSSAGRSFIRQQHDGRASA